MNRQENYWLEEGEEVGDGRAAAKSRQLCPTLCDPIDGSPPGSAVPGILQARTLEWVAISFSNAWSEKWQWSRSVVSDSETPWTAAYQAPLSMGFSRQEHWSGLPLPSLGRAEQSLTIGDRGQAELDSCLLLIASVLVPYWIQFYSPSWKKPSSDVWVVAFLSHLRWHGALDCALNSCCKLCAPFCVWVLSLKD